MMTIGKFNNIKTVIETAGAVIYEAALKDRPYRLFILKKYKKEFSSLELISHEQNISQEITTYAPDSIVVPILDVETDLEGNQYAVMERKISGEFLQSKIAGGTIPVQKALCLTEEVLKALCTLHSFAGNEPRIGYLHLDLHPGNVFIENDSHSENGIGSARFIDLATAVKTFNEQPQNRRVWSVSAYSAPELYQDGTCICSCATDTYSIGAILYTLITGNYIPGILIKDGTTIPNGFSRLGPCPDAGDRAAVFASGHCREAGVPESVCLMLEAFFKCSLNYNPRYRFRTAQEMLDSVRRIRKIFQAYNCCNYDELFSLYYAYSLPIDKTGAEALPMIVDSFGRDVFSLERMMRQDDIDNRKTRYLFNAYWTVACAHRDKIPGEILYSLLSSGIAVCNHNGDVERGDELCREMQAVSGRIGLEKYLEFLNRMAVRHADRFEFNEAIELQKRNIRAQRQIKKGLFTAGGTIGKTSDDNVRIVPLGRALSSLPGYLLLGDRHYPENEIWILYEEALREFGPDDTGNRSITLYHMMHSAIETGNREMYEKTAAEYFRVGAVDFLLWNNIEDIVREAVTSNIKDKFSLYALVKGIYVFLVKKNCSEVSDKVYEMLMHAGEELLPKTCADDPVMQIYKYIGLMEYRRHGLMTDFARKMFKWSQKCY